MGASGNGAAAHQRTHRPARRELGCQLNESPARREAGPTGQQGAERSEPRWSEPSEESR